MLTPAVAHAVIIYKSTEEWIRANCYILSWLKLRHHGDVTGTNKFQNVAALFEIGRSRRRTRPVSAAIRLEATLPCCATWPAA